LSGEDPRCVLSRTAHKRGGGRVNGFVEEYGVEWYELSGAGGEVLTLAPEAS
jgi:hypothetical protein